eukprot:m.32980 g.32980  ORF g.32980 m.32980 type:complete len:131 (-) comp15118_c0_seq1:68-460(-)
MVIVFLVFIPRLTRNGIVAAVDTLKQDQLVTYTFPVFPFRKKSTHAKAIMRKERQCQAGCGSQAKEDSLEFIICVRKCVSPVCYGKLYGFDPLEEGEIDVRLRSFRGCAAEESKKLRTERISEERRAPSH